MAATSIPFFLYPTGSPPSSGGVKSLLAFWMGGATSTTPVTPVITTAAIDVGGKRRIKSGDEELTEAEVQYMFRKLAELKKAKTAKSRHKASNELEISLAKAVRDEDAAQIVQEAVAHIPIGEILRNVEALSDLIRNLQDLVWQEREEDDIAVLLLTQ